MKNIRYATLALNQTPMDWDGNERRLKQALKELAAEKVGLACFPEMAICGYGCEDVFLSDYLYEECLEILESLIPETVGIAVAIGLPLKVNGFRYSALAFVVNGQLQGFYCKKHLANDGLHYEHRWFKPWEDNEIVNIEACGVTVPAGDILFDLNGVKVGFEICEDAWVENRFTGHYEKCKPAVVMNPSASHFAFQKHAIRRNLVVDGSGLIDGVYLYANMSSNEAGRIVYDGSCVIANKAQLISENRRFSFKEIQLDSAVIATRETKQQGSGIIQVDWSPTPLVETPCKAIEAFEDYAVEEEFVLAETLGLFDYMRKSYSRGFMLSLSGGVDSATCAALVYAMVQRVVAEIGIQGLKDRLAYHTDLQDAETVQELMAYLLTCVYQATANSGAVTENAAQTLAKEINAEYHFFDVDPLLVGYKEIVAKAVGRELSWEKDDIALQNIQARVRAPGIWMMTNLKGSLLLTTSNRSEAAVGYATMDGDTCGGLCPLGGTDKTFLRNWLKHFEEDTIAGCGPIPSLSFVNVQEPTAELRPQDQEQKDEEDLMPYDVLDAIEKASIRDKKSPAEIFTLVSEGFGKGNEVTYGWVEKFYALWSRNQWKRERYAPSFHMDDENLDPKTWCRFPILSGGYRRELRRLRESLGL
jgi:NAD+ synthase (glutamine-hydrolysing)